MSEVISSPTEIGFTTRTISVFSLIALLNNGVTAKQMIKDSTMQSTPSTVLFFKNRISSPPTLFLILIPF
jgi:hypothetical protein